MTNQQTEPKIRDVRTASSSQPAGSDSSETRLVFLYRLQNTGPITHSYIVRCLLFARVRLDIENFGVAVHRRRTTAGPRQEVCAAPSAAARRDVGEIRAELLPAHGYEIGTDEGQQSIPLFGIARAEQEVGLVYGVDWAVVRHLACREAGNFGKKSMIENIVYDGRGLM